MDGNFYFVSIVIIAIIAFVEHILLLSWHYGYYTTGILIYRKRVFLSHNINLSPAIHHTQSAIKPNFQHGSIEFNEVKPNTFLFRNKMYELRFYGLNRGDGIRRILCYNPTSGYLEVKGFLNWKYIPIWGFALYFLTVLFIANLSIASLLFTITALISIFLISLYPAVMDTRIDDQVLYHIKVFVRNQITSKR